MASLFRTTVTGSFEANSGSRCCEPYVLVTSIDLRPSRPKVEAFLYGPWQTVSQEDTADIGSLVWQENFWKLHFVADTIAKSDDVIFLIALMEHLVGNPSSCRRMIKKPVVEALDASAGLARETRIARLIDEIDRAVDFANGGPNFTSAVEMSLTADSIMCLETNGCCRFVRSFCGYGGQYCLAIELLRAESDLWTLMLQQDVAFVWAAE